VFPQLEKALNAREERSRLSFYAIFLTYSFFPARETKFVLCHNILSAVKLVLTQIKSCRCLSVFSIFVCTCSKNR